MRSPVRMDRRVRLLDLPVISIARSRCLDPTRCQESSATGAEDRDSETHTFPAIIAVMATWTVQTTTTASTGRTARRRPSCRVRRTRRTTGSRTCCRGTTSTPAPTDAHAGYTPSGNNPPSQRPSYSTSSVLVIKSKILLKIF